MLKNSKIISKPDIEQASPAMGKVAVINAKPESIVDDYARLLDIANYKEALISKNKTLLKVNISVLPSN